MTAPALDTPEGRKERIDYAKLCLDRFTEVCKARLAVGTTIALAQVALTGFGLQTKRYELLLVAAALPIGLLLLIDTRIKIRYAAPFLFIGLAIEHEIFGDDSAAILFARFNPKQKNECLYALANPDRTAGYDAFCRQYVRTGLETKISILAIISLAELALAYVVR